MFRHANESPQCNFLERKGKITLTNACNISSYQVKFDEKPVPFDVVCRRLLRHPVREIVGDQPVVVVGGGLVENPTLAARDGLLCTALNDGL